MFDPAQVSSKMGPGDKMSVSFHKAKTEGGAPSFLSNASNAGMVPGGSPAPAPMPQMSAVSRPAVPGAPDHRALLVALMRRRLMR